MWQPRPWLIWNASPSSPVGLYWLTTPAEIHPGDWIVAWPPPTARELAASRGYLPRNVPLVKRVAATAGDRVCAAGTAIAVKARTVAYRRARDPAGRAMPLWSGCETLRPGDVFLLSQDVEAAFDGRYFGVTRRPAIVGRARLLWAR